MQARQGVSEGKMSLSKVQEHEFGIFYGEKFLVFANTHGIDQKLFSMFAEREGICDPQKAFEAFSDCFAGMQISSRWLKDDMQQGDMWAIELNNNQLAVFITQSLSYTRKLQAAARQTSF